MGAVVMIFEVLICWCSTAVTAVGCSDALEPGGSRGVVFLPLSLGGSGGLSLLVG